jgi:hypothetical protein
MVLRMRSVLRGVVLASMIAVGPVVLWACEDETTGTGVNPPPSGSVTTQPTTSIPGSSGNPGSNEAGADTGASSSSGGPVPHENEDTMKILNFGASPINACYRRGGTQDAFVGPLFRASGIPMNAMSERVVIMKSNVEVKIIGVGETCAAAGVHTTTTNWNTQQSPMHAGIYYTGSAAGLISSGFFEHLAVTPGKESVMSFSGGRAPYFFRGDDAGAPTNLRVVIGTAVALDPDVTGLIRGVGGADPLPETPLFKTKAGGTLTVVPLGDSILLCDDRAPSKDGLTDCSSTIRSN